MSNKQTTICSPISFSGKGLHTGAIVTMVVNPAEADRGIVFRRTDIKGAPEVPALARYVVDTARGTTIKLGKAKVSTIEHLMAALWTMGVDNAVVDINAPETPIMDGSAREYAAEINRVGICELEAERKVLDIKEPVRWAIDKKGVEVVVEPAESYSVDVTVDYNSQVVGRQTASYRLGDDFVTNIAPCRTFVFLHEIELLLKLGLIKGGSVESAIVVVEKPISDRSKRAICKAFNKEDIEVENGYLNHLALRFENEIARHKLLDILGDLALIGRRINGKVTALRPGHLANTETAKLIEKTI
ncbi:MAG: UDP-3-O-[3-hydroxymyristoyl] N-acetylglucosamine deacetylase [Rikenellaceae bacterium]|nr:UDP-3-O-[3-hydroxymyristoyl] N-acetylglucosamine deacetylase [Rikenellaceae bacterium]